METSPKTTSPFRLLSRSNSEIYAKFIRSSIRKSFSHSGKIGICPTSPNVKRKPNYFQKNNEVSHSTLSQSAVPATDNNIILDVPPSADIEQVVPRRIVIQTHTGRHFTVPMCRICHGCSGFSETSGLTLNPAANMFDSCSQTSITNSEAAKSLRRLESHPRTCSPTTHSTISLDSMNGSFRSEGSNQMGKLIAPCLCDGSLKYVHEVCIQQWITVSNSNKCELCQFPFEIRTYTKQLMNWDYLPISKMERRRIICSVLFHILTLICVIWSVVVLTERLIDDVEEQNIGWPFWTKLIVIATGLAGGFIFSYMQWRLYIRLLVRLRLHNRLLVVQLPSEEGIKAARSQRMSTTSAACVPEEIIEVNTSSNDASCDPNLFNSTNTQSDSSHRSDSQESSISPKI